MLHKLLNIDLKICKNECIYSISYQPLPFLLILRPLNQDFMFLQYKFTNFRFVLNLTPGANIIKRFRYKFTHSKLDLFTSMRPILFTFIKWYNLQKNVSKLHQISFMRSTQWCGFSPKRLFTKAAFHWTSFSPKGRLFIFGTVHRIYRKYIEQTGLRSSLAALEAEI